MAKESEYLNSFKEWCVRVPQKWWEVLMIPLTYIPLFAGVVTFSVWARHIHPPLPWWNIGIVAGGALLFLIISFLAFHRVRVERDQEKKRVEMLESQLKTSRSSTQVNGEEAKSSAIGGFAGRSVGGRIENCSATGKITVDGDSKDIDVGAFIGQSQDTQIVNSGADMEIEIKNPAKGDKEQ